MGVKLGLSCQKENGVLDQITANNQCFYNSIKSLQRSRNRRHCNRTGHIFCCCMLIKINFVIENINYTEINTEKLVAQVGI
jgi:hypothetical protein